MTTKCRECNAYLARIALYQRRAHGLAAQLFGQRVEVRG